LKDNVAVGAIAGLIGGIIGLAYSYIMFLLGITPMSSVNLAATLVVIDVLNLSALAFINAIFTHLLVASTFGVLLTYILLYTGKDFWLLKGFGFGALFCLVAHSYLIPLMRTDEQVRTLIFNPISWTIALSTHIMIGLISVTIIVKYHFLFKKNLPETVPDNKIKTKSYHLNDSQKSKKVLKKKILFIKPKKLL
jgi:hypothetical protein